MSQNAEHKMYIDMSFHFCFNNRIYYCNEYSIIDYYSKNK